MDFRNLIMRLIKWAYKVGYIKGYVRMSYDGDVFSLNDLYSQKHWGARSATKNKYRKLFSALVEQAKEFSFEKYALITFYNTRHDVDNITGMTKIFIDTIKKNEVLDDAKKNYRGLLIFPDEALKSKVEFIIIGL